MFPVEVPMAGVRCWMRRLSRTIEAIIDEEGKVRSRTPNVCKFRHEPFDMDDDERCEIYRAHHRSRAAGHEQTTSPRSSARRSKHGRTRASRGDGAGIRRLQPDHHVDAAQIVADLPEAHVLHVVRNPWSAYADTKKRPVPLSLEGYILRWNINQHYALLERERHPGRVHIVRIEDVMADPAGTLGALLAELGLRAADSLAGPSWNAKVLDEVYPWGTIRAATPQANVATAAELSDEEQREIGTRAWQYLEVFGYETFLESGRLGAFSSPR